MSDENVSNVFVVLCDWRGRIVWMSPHESTAKAGDLAWVYFTPESQERAKEALGRVATLREAQNITVENQAGKHLRLWLWPLDSPQLAICALGMEVPAALKELTDRELECLELMAQGLESKEIAERLDVSLSTLHTHMKRAREKLGLPGVEALISFAARFCYPPSKPFPHPDE
jgi:DNA-binding CsgD family transcriptional regulator